MMADSPVRLDAPLALRTRVGWELPSVAFGLVLHPARTAFSLEIELSGAGLQLVEATSIEYASVAGSSSPDEPVRIAELSANRAKFVDVRASPIGETQFGFLRVLGRAHSEGNASLILRVSLGGETAMAEARLDVGGALRVPLLPEPVEPSVFADAWLERRCEAYNGRTWAVGSLSFDAAFDQLGEWLLHWTETMADFVRHVGRAQALDVSITGDGRSERLAPLEAGGSIVGPATVGVLDALQRGALLRLSAPGDPPFAQIALAHRRRDDPRSPSSGLELSWEMPRPASASDRQRVAALMRQITDEACLLRECIAAFASASGAPLGSLPSPLPYEELANRAAVSTRHEWMRRHVRSPGWRTLIPREALETPPSMTQCESKETQAGRLLMATSGDPFSMSEEELASIERCALPYVGTTQEVKAALRSW